MDILDRVDLFIKTFGLATTAKAINQVFCTGNLRVEVYEEACRLLGGPGTPLPLLVMQKKAIRACRGVLGRFGERHGHPWQVRRHRQIEKLRSAGANVAALCRMYNVRSPVIIYAIRRVDEERKAHKKVGRGRGITRRPGVHVGQDAENAVHDRRRTALRIHDPIKPNPGRNSKFNRLHGQEGSGDTKDHTNSFGKMPRLLRESGVESNYDDLDLNIDELLQEA